MCDRGGRVMLGKGCIKSVLRVCQGCVWCLSHDCTPTMSVLTGIVLEPMLHA
jgi:hypothetical protein